MAYPVSGRAKKFARKLRLVTLSFAACLCAGVGAASASVTSLPPQGIFENCNLDAQMATCLQRLQVMHQGGLQVVVIPAGGSLGALQTYAAAAHSLGMSVMWELSNPVWWQDPPTSTTADGYLPAFTSACGCAQNGQLLAYFVHWLGQLPGTYGYYAADDLVLTPGDQTSIAAYVSEIKQQDPVHTVMIGAADESQASTYLSIADVIGTELYPVTTSSLMPVSANQDMWSSVAQGAVDAQRAADGAGKQSAFILQAFTWGDNLSDGQIIGACSSGDTQLSCYSKLRYPSSAEQLQLRNEMLQYAHPKLILWWSFPGTYGQAGADTYSVYPSGAEAAARWDGLSAAIQAPLPAASGPAQQQAHLAASRPPAKHKGHVALMNLKRHRRLHRRHHRGHHRQRHHLVKPRHGHHG